MSAVPYAELAIKSISLLEEEEVSRVRNRLVNSGIPSDRLRLLPWTHTYNDHLKSYQEIDIALDTSPYSGATTSCEALIMGVPVISLAGKEIVNRLSATILYHAGCKKWVVNSELDYISLAKQLAKSGIRDKLEREKLRTKIRSSALGNPKRLANKLENKLAQLVKAEKAL